jgi:hypothetical protein
LTIHRNSTLGAIIRGTQARAFVPAIALIMLLVAPAGAVNPEKEPDMTPHVNRTLLIDDFSDADRVSALGTRWEGLTDRVMGGRSEMEMAIRESSAGPVLGMRGTVRLENRGGFIQARLPLDPGGSHFDASDWWGVRLKVRGAPGPYYVHLRTRQNWLPWQYYRSRFEIGPEWRDVSIPFTAFEGAATWRALDVRSLKSIAVVAYGEAFEADIEVARIELVAP